MTADNDIIAGLDDDSFSTQELIAEARRPVLIQRHKDMLDELEGGISPSFVSGTTDHPRFQAMLVELDQPSEQSRITSTLLALADDPVYESQTVQTGLIEFCCLLREERGVEFATIQLHIIGIYRRIRELMLQHQTLTPDLDDLRTLSCQRLGRLLSPIKSSFGVPGMDDAVVVTKSQSERMIETIRALTAGQGGDNDWEEHNSIITLPREMEEPLRALPEDQRAQARAKLVGGKIRSRFFRAVFLKYFDRDTLGDEEIDAHKNILHWLESIGETPHLYPFMQGQDDSQKTFRLSRLLRKVIQLNEVYQRVTMASQHPSYRDTFKELNIREKLSLLAKDHYPPLKVDNQFMINTALCSFRTFAEWVQEQVEQKEFILPPDAKS